MRALAMALLAALLAAPSAAADAGAVSAEVPSAAAGSADAISEGIVPVSPADAFACPAPCPGPDGGLADGCSLNLGTDPGLRCGSGEGPCSVLDEPACWSVRMACYYVYGPLGRQGIECQTQPGCCNLTLAGDAGLALALPDIARLPEPADDKCTNYGVQVIVSVGGSRCHVCENHGVQVIVGDCGGTPARVCAGETCLVVDCGVRLDDLAPTGGPETQSADRGCT